MDIFVHEKLFSVAKIPICSKLTLCGLKCDAVWLHGSHLGTKAMVQYKMLPYQFRKSHCGNKTVLRLSHLHNGNSYAGNTASLYWISPLGLSQNGDPSFTKLYPLLGLAYHIAPWPGTSETISWTCRFWQNFLRNFVSRKKFLVWHQWVKITFATWFRHVTACGVFLLHEEKQWCFTLLFLTYLNWYQLILKEKSVLEVCTFHQFMLLKKIVKSW